MKLSAEQNLAIELGLDDSLSTLFVTGEGGTGKSEVIINLMERLNQFETILLAPTQSAALKIGGKTIHSFFKIRPTINLNVEKESDVISFCLDEVDTDNLDGKIVIIDEVSMLGEQMLTGILSRIKPKKLILFGDPDQAKPIKDNPVDWSEFCDQTVHLTYNYRVQNEKLRDIISHYRKTSKVHVDTTKIDDISELTFDENTIYMAHTNTSLSNLQRELLGYSHGKLGDTMLTFGASDDSIKRRTMSGGRSVITNYFNNNDLVKIVSVPRMIDDKLWSCEIVRLDNEPIFINEYNKIPKIIVGDYTTYKKILQKRFKVAQNLQNTMKKKYKVDNNGVLKKKMTPDEVLDLRNKWIEYFNLKNSPYARHHQFRTAYKAQGQSFDKVVIDWHDIPSKDLKYVAISRAMNNLTLIVS